MFEAFFKIFHNPKTGIIFLLLLVFVGVPSTNNAIVDGGLNIYNKITKHETIVPNPLQDDEKKKKEVLSADETKLSLALYKKVLNKDTFNKKPNILDFGFHFEKNNSEVITFDSKLTLVEKVTKVFEKFEDIGNNNTPQLYSMYKIDTDNKTLKSSDLVTCGGKNYTIVEDSKGNITINVCRNFQLSNTGQKNKDDSEKTSESIYVQGLYLNDQIRDTFYTPQNRAKIDGLNSMSLYIINKNNIEILDYSKNNCKNDYKPLSIDSLKKEKDAVEKYYIDKKISDFGENFVVESHRAIQKCMRAEYGLGGSFEFSAETGWFAENSQKAFSEWQKVK
jgi:hypothetical protein